MTYRDGRAALDLLSKYQPPPKPKMWGKRPPDPMFRPKARKKYDQWQEDTRAYQNHTAKQPRVNNARTAGIPWSERKEKD